MDEFQDTSTNQYQLARMLTLANRRLTVVGMLRRPLLFSPALDTSLTSLTWYFLSDLFRMVVLYRYLLTISCSDGWYTLGDDAQSIYGFRGASLENFAWFMTDFDKWVTVVTLQMNFRSTGCIVGMKLLVIFLIRVFLD